MTEPIEQTFAWRLLLAIAELRRTGALASGRGAYRLDARDELHELDAGDKHAELIIGDDGQFDIGPALDSSVSDFVELYLPMLARRDNGMWTLAHLGQSIDGCIATASGHSVAVTGHADFVHMHRLRALADAVLVGAGTVAADDPKLTTRLVDGPSPVRVVLDPRGRLDGSLGVFTDGAARTLWVHAADAVPTPDDEHGSASGREAQRETQREAVALAGDADSMALSDVLTALSAHGIRTLFIEGGGVTVTRFIEAALLDRLHLVVAPVLVGAGRPALRLPAIDTMEQSLRPRGRMHLLGQDVLWDFDLRQPAAADAPASSTMRRLV